MSTKIFPDSIINVSTETMIAKYRKSTSALYLVVLAAVIVAFVSLFFIHVQIGVRAQGIIKTQGERNLLTAPISGRLAMVHLTENLSVNKGDTLFVIDARTITARLPALQNRNNELTAIIADLQTLTHSAHTKPTLRSPLYTQQYAAYTAQLSDYQYKEKVAKNNYARSKTLFDSEVIAKAEFEQAQADKENAAAACRSFLRNTMAQWQADLTQYENEYRDIAAQMEQIDIQRNEAVVLAPAAGTIQSIEQVSNGMFVYSGQQIAELSPGGQLVAECAVATRDIGYVYAGQPVRLQVDAFDYNIWGMMEGNVAVIFDDIVMPAGSEQTPYYRLYCTLGSDHLALQNGRKGYLKKGMTVSARLITTERTLFQLLYDKADKWLNPNL